MIDTWLTNFLNGVYYVTEPKIAFENEYIEVRQKEKRVHDDDFVKQLPMVDKQHPHALEWKKRQWTLDLFEKTISKKHQVILEVGCGNGWFSNHLLKHSKRVIGLDVGKLELEQAARCFMSNHLDFVCCQDLTLLPKNSFDLIVFNASIQYFDHTPDFWKNLSDCLTKNGEIHLLDSPIYKASEILEAQQRTLHYFEEIGNTGAKQYYHHLSKDNLPKHAKVIYRPNLLLRKIQPSRSPFPYVKIGK